MTTVACCVMFLSMTLSGNGWSQVATSPKKAIVVAIRNGDMDALRKLIALSPSVRNEIPILALQELRVANGADATRSRRLHKQSPNFPKIRDLVASIISDKQDFFAVSDVEEDALLRHAVLAMHPPTIELLLKKGIDINQPVMSSTPLIIAVRYNPYRPGSIYSPQREIVAVARTLIAYGSAVNASDENGWTALHYAVVGKKRMVAQLLLDNGADTNKIAVINEAIAKDMPLFDNRMRQEVTPLDLAYGDPDMSAMLLKYGAKGVMHNEDTAN